MGTQLYNIGITGLNAAQAGLVTTGHNITNAATPGYNRQQVVLGTNDPQMTGGGFLGQGTRIETVRRVYNQFLTAQVMEAKTQSAEYGAYADQINALDNLLADSDAGLSPALSQFFDALQSVSASPTSLASRQSAISAAQAMTARFNALDERLEQVRSGLNGEIAGSVGLINQLGSQIARYNEQIAAAEGISGPNRPPNDMLDAREQLISELNDLVRVTQLQQSDGSINLFIGNGQPLVVGNSSFKLAATASLEDASRTEVTYTAPGGAVLRLQEDTITGGKLGGLLAFRRETLDEAQNALGRIAISMADQFNAQHALGQDLNGALGTNVFNVLAGSALSASTNSTVAAAQVNVTISDTSNPTTSDYRLGFDGANYTLTRLSDNQSWSAATLGAGFRSNHARRRRQLPDSADAQWCLGHPHRAERSAHAGGRDADQHDGLPVEYRQRQHQCGHRHIYHRAAAGGGDHADLRRDRKRVHGDWRSRRHDRLQPDDRLGRCKFHLRRPGRLHLQAFRYTA